MYGATPVWDTRDAKAWKTTRPLITCLLWSAIPCGMQRLLLLMGLCVWLCGCVLMMQLWCWWCHIYVRQVLYGIAFVGYGLVGEVTELVPVLVWIYVTDSWLLKICASDTRLKSTLQMPASKTTLQDLRFRMLFNGMNLSSGGKPKTKPLGTTLVVPIRIVRGLLKVSNMSFDACSPEEHRLQWISCEWRVMDPMWLTSMSWQQLM